MRIFNIFIFFLIIFTSCHKKETNFENILPGDEILIIPILENNQKVMDYINIHGGFNTKIVRYTTNSQTNVTYLDLSMFENLDEIEILNNTHLETIDLSGLKKINIKLRIDSNYNLKHVLLDKLEDVEYLSLYDNIQLMELNLPLLIKGKLLVYGDDIASFSAPNFTESESVDFRSKTIINLSFPSLKTSSNIVIAGCFLLEDLSFPELTDVFEKISILGNTNLMNLQLPELKYAKTLDISGYHSFETLYIPKINGSDITLSQFPVLRNINFPNFKTGSINVTKLKIINFELPNFENGGLYFELNSELESISFPKLVNSNLIDIRNNSKLSSVNFPILEKTTGEVYFYSNHLIETISFPLLEETERFILNKNWILSSLNLPKLSKTNGLFYICYHPSLSQLPLPSLISFNSSVAISNNHINTISLPSFVNVNGSYIDLSHNLLNNENVNYMLSKFVNINSSTTYTLDLRNNAQPTGQGIIDKQTIINAGNTVFTD